jgi:hypothetical protein
MLNDNDNDNDNEESKSTQSKGTYSKASDGCNDVSTIGDLDAAPRDPTRALIGDGLDPATQLLFSNLTAATNGNNGNNCAVDEESFLPIVGSIGELDVPPRDPNSELMANGFDLVSQLLLSNITAASNGNDGNNGAANEESFLPIVGSIGESNVPPSRDPTSELMADGFPLASQLLLFNRTNGVINDECLPLTKR